MGIINQLKNYWISHANGSPAKKGQEVFVPVSGRPPLCTRGQANMTIQTCAKILAESICLADYSAYNRENKRLHFNFDSILNIKPNAFQTSTDFWYVMTLNMILWGNGYAYLKFANGRLAEMIPLNPRFMKVLVDDIGLFNDMKLVYEYTEERTGQVITFLPGEILHLKFNSRNGLIGIPTEEALYPLVNEDQESEDYLKEVYANGYSGVLTLTYTGDLDTARRKKVMAQIKDILQAQGNRMLALPDGIEAKVLGSGSIDSSYVDLRDRTVRKIAGYLRVPLILLDDNSGTGTASMGEAQTLSYYQHSLKPHIKRICEELSVKLLTTKQLEDGIRVDEADISGFLMLDAKSRTENLVKLSAGGIITVNEARQELGFEPYIDDADSGNKLYRNGAFTSGDNGDSTGDKSQKVKFDNAQKEIGESQAIIK